VAIAIREEAGSPTVGVRLPQPLASGIDSGKVFWYDTAPIV
jgi:hypothetical protein